MADTLEDYFRTEYLADIRTVDDTERLIDEIVNLFGTTFIETHKTWPYELVAGQPPKDPEKYTFSTNAMIVFALGLATDKISRSSLAPIATDHGRVVEPGADDEALATIQKRAKTALARLEQESTKLADDHLTSSSTFGWDDPLTLTWLVEALAAYSPEGDYLAKVRNRAWTRVTEIRTRGPFLDLLQFDQENQQVSHSFPLLRILQLGNSVTREQGKPPLCEVMDLSGIRERLLERIHRHLSESKLPGRGFDAADMVFATEAWILCTEDEPDHAVVGRVFDVLAEKQEANPYWRPVRPFKASPQGLVLLPQSVETANSLLRICGSRGESTGKYFSKHLELFEGYRSWLMSRVFRGRTGADTTAIRFVGWESDHTYKQDRIHLWQTSQVLIFLKHYAATMRLHVARTSMNLARLRSEPVPAGTQEERLKEWTKFMGGDPLLGVDSEGAYAAYNAIDRSFVQPRLGKRKAKPLVSMLLYGPPGTGKTTIAEKMASALGYRLLTVTPSDFISAGGEAVEARAKAIFQLLEHQSELVVLFDEIDNLLLDRDSEFYREQGDVFKLLTPGMLTKLNRLTKCPGLVVVVATNYYERIDRAIKRKGRIDARYLILPPNALQRDAMIEKKLPPDGKAAGDTRVLVAQTVFFTYKELGDLLQDAFPSGSKLARAAVLARALEIARTSKPMINLKSYGDRLGVSDPHDPSTPFDRPVSTIERPWEELALLALLARETGDGLSPLWLGTAVQRALGEEEAVRDKAIADSLNKGYVHSGG